MPPNPAFEKGSDEATTLRTMFLDGTLSWTAEPKDLYNKFSSVKENCTSTQFRTGFNKVRKEAKEIWSYLQTGKVDC
jgi:hypothetical protein